MTHRMKRTHDRALIVIGAFLFGLGISADRAAADFIAFLLDGGASFGAYGAGHSRA